MQRILLIVVGVLLVGSQTCLMTSAAPQASPESAGGVVVRSVEPGSAFAEAGIEPEDVILAWRRLPAPPANPEEASGKIESGFDFLWLANEQAPRGVVELTVERGGEVLLVRVAPGLWEQVPSPRMPDSRFEDYMRGRIRLGAASAERLWMKVVETTDDWRLRCWILMTAGTLHYKLYDDWEKGYATYRLALEEAEELFPRLTIWLLIGTGLKNRGQMEQAQQALETARELAEGESETLVLAMIRSWPASPSWPKIEET